MPSLRFAGVSGCAQGILPPDEIQAEVNYQIHHAMKILYRDGCRRIRVVPMCRTGDDLRFMVMGWPS